MSTRRCCEGELPKRRLSPRIFGALGCAAPYIALPLLPKCPACLAAWIALGTGISLPVAAAGGLQLLLVVLCFAPIVLLAARRWQRRRATGG